MSDDTGLPINDAETNTEELLKKKKKLEAELKEIESELQKSNTFSCSDGIIFSSKSGKFTRTMLEKKFTMNHSINSQSNDMNSCKERSFEKSSVFDLRGTFVSKKKETFFVYGVTPNLAKIVSPRIFDQRYYLGCLTELVKEYAQEFLERREYEYFEKLSECNVVVYYKSIIGIPSYMQRKFMLAAMSGFRFEAANELVGFDFLDHREMCFEFDAGIEEYKTVSEFIRKCYGAGMKMPFDGRVMAIMINNEDIAEDVEEAVILLGGCPFVMTQKHAFPFGVSHLIHDGRKVKDKATGFVYRIHYDDFFKDLEIEFNRLKARAFEEMN